DQEADGVEEPVVPVEGDQAGDAEERRGRHVVAADRHAVLQAGEGAATGVEVGGVVGTPAGPDRDEERDEDEEPEQRQRDVALGPYGDGGEDHQCCPPWCMALRIWSAAGSSLRLAKRAYSHAMRNVDTNCSNPNTSATLMLPTTFVLMNPRAYAESTT